MAFYNPLSLKIAGISTIIYPDQGLEKIMERITSAVHHHIEALFAKTNLPKDTDYLIIFLWAEKNEVMTDMWIFTKTDAWGSGPLADVWIFQGHKKVDNVGVGSGNTLLVLGRAEEERRKSKNLEDYLSGLRPKLPDELMLGEYF